MILKGSYKTVSGGNKQQIESSDEEEDYARKSKLSRISKASKKSKEKSTTNTTLDPELSHGIKSIRQDINMHDLMAFGYQKSWLEQAKIDKVNYKPPKKYKHVFK